MKKIVPLMLCLPVLAAAQMVLGPPLGHMMTSGHVYSQAAASLSQDALRGDGKRRAKAPPARQRSADAARPVVLDVRVGGADVARVAHQLSTSFPPEHQSAAVQMYEALFKTYEGSYPKTLSGALAALLVGSYAAFNNVIVPDEQSLAVLKQFDPHIRQSPEGLHAIAAQDRKDAYVQMIMLGMQLMASTMQSQQAGVDPAPLQRLKAAGRRNLEGILKVPASRVSIGPGGMRLD